ncbi:MAG: hypothetical protein H7Z41_18035 [Cytophagales bacterium]|nr:hypothetical protein [Armatimonadota bacterium]
MDNPWTKVGARYALPEDEWYVRRVNIKAKPPQQAQLQLPPLPYIGNPRTARVILLGKNPSYSPLDDEDLTRVPDLETENMRTLTFESEYPFFYLDPRFEGTNLHKVWNDALADLLNACQTDHQVDRDTVLSRIAVVQWHPYRSQRSFDFKDLEEPLVSQAYNLELVRHAVHAKRLFVLQYGAANAKLWRTKVPELPADAVTTNSPQSSNLSRGNMSPENFERLVQALSAPEPEAATA